MTAKEILKLLQDKAGLQRLVATAQRETDPIEYKREYNRRVPRWEDELRSDCAALATVGCGFLIVGIKESGDGHSRATELVGVQDAPDLINAIKDNLERGLSPLITKRDAWAVPLDEPATRWVVVAQLEGRVGYPIEVVGKREPPRHIIREGGKKVWLSAEDARLRRSHLEIPAARRHTLRIAIPAAVLAAIACLLLYARFRRATEVDPDLCPTRRHQGMMYLLEPPLADIRKSAADAINARDAAGCWRANAELWAQYPAFVGRYLVEGACYELDGNTASANSSYRHSVDLSARALRRRPGLLCLRLAHAFSLAHAGRRAEACDELTAIAQTPRSWENDPSRFDVPAMTALDMDCPPGAEELLRALKGDDQ